MSPRPILKPSAFSQPNHPHRHQQPASAHPSVHFPPSPSLTRTFLVHSASAYDRSPIVVSQNDCALPERGCPGRTYFEDSAASRQRQHTHHMSISKGYHPRAFSSPSSTLGSNYGVPLLVPDLSSESDESDGVASLPPPSSIIFGPHGLPSSSTIRAVSNSPNLTMHTHGYAACDHDAALAFLPYSPYPYDVPEENILQKEKLRRRRDKKHESSIDPDRIPSGDAHISQFTQSFACLSISRSTSPSRSPASTQKKKNLRRQESCFTPTFPTLPDDGCLGGF